MRLALVLSFALRLALVLSFALRLILVLSLTLRLALVLYLALHLVYRFSFACFFSNDRSFSLSLFCIFSNLLSPPKPSARLCSPARWDFPPRWCDAQERMGAYERVHSYVHVCLTVAGIVRCVVAAGGRANPLVARVSRVVVSNCTQKARKLSFDFHFLKKEKQNHFDNIFFTCSIEFFVAIKLECVRGNTLTLISSAFCKYESAFEYSPMFLYTKPMLL